MRYNIWQDKEEEITEIGFNKEDSKEYIAYGRGSDVIYIHDCDGDTVYMYLNQIDDLITALRKAKELWGNK